MQGIERAKSNRLRTGRCSGPQQVYLITTTTYSRLPIFRDCNIARLLVNELKTAQDDGWVLSLAWVVMPDHLHWLAQLQSCSLDELLRRVKGRSARLINIHRSDSGPVWQAGYHDRTIRQEEDLQAMARYIVANPLRAGLVKQVGDYPLWDAMWL